MKEEAKLTATSSEWYTPPKIIEAARTWMGSIDLDPASCELANRAVRAARFFDEATDGLKQRWQGNVFLNPPTPPRPWWERTVAMHVEERTVTTFVAYSIETLSQSQGSQKRDPRPWGGASMLAFSVCIPKGRLRFWCTARDSMGQLAEIAKKRCEAKPPKPIEPALLKWFWELAGMPPDFLVEGDAPTHSSAIIGVGGDHDAFAEAFKDIGAVMRGITRGSLPRLEERTSL